MPRADQGAGADMNLKVASRFHQALYMVTLLILAVALTTALVVAAERSSSESSKEATSQVLQGSQAPTAGRPGLVECE
jgi:hypothetical protein